MVFITFVITDSNFLQPPSVRSAGHINCRYLIQFSYNFFTTWTYTWLHSWSSSCTNNSKSPFIIQSTCWIAVFLFGIVTKRFYLQVKVDWESKLFLKDEPELLESCVCLDGLIDRSFQYKKYKRRSRRNEKRK